ncbi:hypothetical protein [Pseudonocardia xinjiangensis]|uniref:DUF222 domain-containing protein n=1 Tax=Pseudonocardia xinjiangensis TaxID=75289 RepID=A0ABX1RLV9_9PSEU|nr:hypothetical protein [Pseudonocardia xinjiangensis]NMH80090.1 hypothetical protein [Pseudonocardia xinjiangensis]
MRDKRLMDIAREVVAAVHPDELDHFEQAAEAYDAHPGTVAYARGPRAEGAHSGVRTVTGFSALVLDVTAGACRGVLGAESPAPVARNRGWLARNRGWLARSRCVGSHVGTATVLPSITDAKAAEIEVTACAAAVVRGASGDDAAALAKVLSDRWTRR